MNEVSPIRELRQIRGGAVAGGRRWDSRLLIATGDVPASLGGTLGAIWARITSAVASDAGAAVAWQ